MDLCLESVADWTLTQLMRADLLETDPDQGECSTDRRLYRLTALGHRVLKDRRSRPGPIQRGA